MKHTYTLLILLLVGATFSQKASAQTTTNSQIEFSCYTYQQLAKNHSENVFFSPISLHAVLAACYPGTNGATQQEFERVLQLPSNDIVENAKYLKSSLNFKEAKGVTLDISNNIWFDASIQLNKEYTDVIKMSNTDIASVNFIDNAEIARQHINQTVTDKTNSKIKDLLPVNSINGLTRMVLTNAIYFQGNWAEQFDQTENVDGDFWLTNEESQAAMFMHRKSDYLHASNDDFQILEMPYTGNTVGMYIILPNTLEGLSNIESQLNSENLASWIEAMGKKEVDVYLPKFKLESDVNVRKYLEQMGLNLAFTEESDFSGITKVDIHLSNVFQKAFVEVNEEGTEAAASTSATFMTKGASYSPSFHANRPFIFVIRENTSGNILFMGRLSNPAVKSVKLGVQKTEKKVEKKTKKVADADKSGDSFYHVVSGGETLYQISRNYDVDIEQIADVNNLKSNTIFNGQKLLIAKNAKMKEEMPVLFPAEYNFGASRIKKAPVHIVQKGETLFSIAKAYHMSVADIKTFNELKNDKLAVGQLLRLQKSERFLIHIVQSGDTLSYIAEKYEKNLTDIIKENKLNTDKIFIGQELKIEL